MQHLDLFSGIGGFALAASKCGFETVGFCENNNWCVENALNKNWPDIPVFNDVRTLCRRISHNLDETGDEYNPDFVRCSIHGVEFGECACIGTDEFGDCYGQIDIITAGVPCQPASIIGKRKGKDDDRWFWDDTIRIINELDPEWAIFENPTGILTLDNGQAFRSIVEGISEAGYDLWWETIPASVLAMGHKRDRVWIVAHSRSQRLERYTGDGNPINRQIREEEVKVRPVTQETLLPNWYAEGWWQNQSPVPIVVDGISDPTFWKQAVIATGNAIVPQIAEIIMQGIKNATINPD